MTENVRIGDYDVPRESFVERFSRLQSEYEIPLTVLAEVADIKIGNLSAILSGGAGIGLKKVKQMGKAYDMIPVVLYNDLDQKVEDLGLPWFKGMEEENYVGRVVADVRKQRELTYLQVTSETGISKFTQSHLEKGKRDPNLTTLEHVCSILSLSPFYLVEKTRVMLPESVSKDEETMGVSEAYYVFGGNVNAMAKYFGVSHHTVTRRLREFVFGDYNGGPKNFFKTLKHNRIVDRIVEEYIKTCDRELVARNLGCSVSTVIRHLREEFDGGRK